MRREGRQADGALPLLHPRTEIEFLCVWRSRERRSGGELALGDRYHTLKCLFQNFVLAVQNLPALSFTVFLYPTPCSWHYSEEAEWRNVSIFKIPFNPLSESSRFVSITSLLQPRGKVISRALARSRCYAFEIPKCYL